MRVCLCVRGEREREKRRERGGMGQSEAGKAKVGNGADVNVDEYSDAVSGVVTAILAGNIREGGGLCG